MQHKVGTKLVRVELLYSDEHSFTNDSLFLRIILMENDKDYANNSS